MARELGMAPEDIVKLASNESPLPPFPEVQEAITATVDRYGGLTTLVNNAAATDLVNTGIKPLTEHTTEEWDAIIRTTLTGNVFWACKYGIPHLVEAGGGSIVNISSGGAMFGSPGISAYSAAKAGLIGLTRSLAREFGGRGIRVNAVAPGFTVTEMTADLADTETGRQRLRDMPLGRFGRADEVADAVLFLLSDASSLFLGQTLNPNAGGYMP